jgi:hypothetical protein
MNRNSSIILSLGTLGVLSALEIACSDSGAGRPGVEQVPAPASPTSVTEEVVPRSEIAFAVAPNSTCKLYEGAVIPAKAVNVYSDDQGIVRLYASPVRPSEGPKVLSVDCNEGTANHVVRNLDLADPATFRSIEPPAEPINRTVLPALGAERDSISVAELLKRGYPPRPDAAKRPEAYARWVSFVSRPISVVKPNVVESDIHADPETDTVHPSWGGDILTGPNPYYLSDVTFAIPQIPNSPAGRAVVWGGLGGFLDNALIQNGVDLNATGTAAQYHAFYEYAPNHGTDITNFSVRPGDVLESYSYPTDNNLNWNAVGTYGCFGFNNITQGTTCTGLCAQKNSRSTFQGLTAEFIVEPQSGPVPNIGNFEVDGWAWAAGGVYADMSTDPYTLQQLDNKALTTTLVQVSRINNSGIQLFWLSGTR